jgi:hypothetical protein
VFYFAECGDLKQINLIERFLLLDFEGLPAQYSHARNAAAN